MRGKVLAIVALGMGVALAGCSQFSRHGAGCSEEGTQRLVKKIFNNTLTEQLTNSGTADSIEQIAGAIGLSLQTITTQSHDEKTDRYECKATLQATLPRAAQQAMAGDPLLLAAAAKEGLNVVDGGIQARLEYTSQFTDSGDEQLVEGSGFQELAQAIAAIHQRGGFAPAMEQAAQIDPPEASDLSPEVADAPVIAEGAHDQGQTQEPSVTMAPSFDCAKASTKAEHMICANPSLAKADAELAQAYKDALGRGADRVVLKKTQAAWRKDVRDACSDSACMLEAMNARQGLLISI